MPNPREELAGAAGLIAATRAALGLTQRELAARAGCSRSSVQLIEGGYAPARSAVLPRLVIALRDAAGEKSA